MIDKKIKLLIIDDDEVDRLAIKRAIKLSGFNADILMIDRYEQGIESALLDSFDCIFVDYNLPGYTGLQFIKEYRRRGGESPLVIITSHGDEKLAVETMKSGACDYIPKSSITAETVGKSIRYAMKIKDSQSNTTRIERALVETEQKLNAVVSKSPLILFSINESGFFTLFKGKAMESLSLEEGDVIGKSVFEIWNRLPVKLQDVKKALLGEEFIQLTQFNNSFFEVHYIPSRSADGTFTGVMGIATDITGHKEQEKELKNQIILSTETQRIKEQFLANMSHEIRTPIHGIIGITKIVLQSELKKEQNNYLNAIKKSADNLLVIINDILDFSKIEAEKMTFENTCFNLNDLINTIIELFKTRADEKNIKLVFEDDASLSQLVKGDPVRLSQIINNLIGNAIKFTHSGSVSLILNKIESNDKCTMIGFRVKDTGIGIPQNKLATIFDSFSQAGNDIARKYGGTGLGLSIAKKLVELQGGTIHVESKVNAGTTFSFTIPFNNPEPGEMETAEKKVADKHIDFKKKIKMLVVEDNDINRLIINKHIIDWGFEHDVAENGVIALEKLQNNDYDLVLMDIEMPEMNGYEAAEKIRSTFSGDKKSIPILAMTAHATSTEKEKCYTAGMNDYVSKPFDPTEVKNKIIELVYPTSKENRAEEVFETPKENLKPSTPQKRLTDLTFLHEMSGGGNSSFFKEFIALFVQNIPLSLTDLEEGVKDKDWEKVRQAAHKMKPSVNYVGLKQTYEIVMKVEKFSKEEINLDDVPSMVKQIIDDCSVAILELESEAKEVSA